MSGIDSDGHSVPDLMYNGKRTSVEERREGSMMKEIYLAGGCFWGVEAVFSRVSGVVSTEAGYANSRVANPSYEQVCTGETGAAEAVKVVYDPKKTDLTELLGVFFAIINPYTLNRQGNDVGTQYRTGIYYTAKEDEPILEYFMNFMRQRGRGPAVTGTDMVLNEEPDPLQGRKIMTELCRLESFYPAEEMHQQYLAKHPTGYCHIDLQRLVTEGIIRE